MSGAASEYKKEFLIRAPNTIKVHGEARIRENTPNLEPQIKAIMLSFQISGQLSPITIDEDDYLIAGYLRLIAARRLAIKIMVIKIHGLSDFEKYLIEIQENTTRTDFTSYEFTIGLTKLKRKYEKEHPETKWGRNQYENGVSRGDTPKNEIMPTFAKKHAELFGYSESAIRQRIRVGEAILKGNFDQKSIKLFKEDKITFTELRERIKVIEKLKIDKEEVLSKNHEKNQESKKKKRISEPKKPEKDSKSDTPKQEKDSIQEEKKLEEILPVPPTSPLPQNDANTTIPPGSSGGPTIQIFDNETKNMVEVPATCKDCPSGRAFACKHCGTMMIRCSLDEKEGKFGIYMGTHLVCGRYKESSSDQPSY